MSHPDREFLLKYLSPLVGGKITAVDAQMDDDDFGGAWPKITVVKGAATYELEISMDEEGNGPGFVFGLPMPR